MAAPAQKQNLEDGNTVLWDPKERQPQVAVATSKTPQGRGRPLTEAEIRALVFQGKVPRTCGSRGGLHNWLVGTRVVVLVGGLLLLMGSGLTVRRSFAWDGPFCSAEGMSALATLEEGSVRPICGVAPSTVQAPAFIASVIPTWVTRPVERKPPEELDGLTAWARVQEFRTKGALADAVLHLSVVEAAFPKLADRFAMLRGELRLELGDYENAIRDFEIARDSLDGRVRGKSRVRRVEAKILADHQDADSALVGLLQFYPELPDGPNLRFLLAQWNERKGSVQDAARIYRDLYLTRPGTSLALKAQGRLEALRARGVSVRALTPIQEVSRLETLSRRGPHALAREEAARLLERSGLSQELRDRVHLVAARIARIEGRFQDAASHFAAGGRRGGGGDEGRAREVTRLVSAARTLRATRVKAAQKQVAGLRNGRPWMSIPPPRLLGIVRVASAAGLRGPADEALRALSRMRNIPPQVLFEAGVLAAGTASDTLVAATFQRVGSERGPNAVAARYHHARALERLGRYQAAERGYHEVRRADRGETRWYAMLSELRLRRVREAQVCNCNPDEAPRVSGTPSKPGAVTARRGASGQGRAKAGSEPTPSLRELLAVPAPNPTAGTVVQVASTNAGGVVQQPPVPAPATPDAKAAELEQAPPATPAPSTPTAAPADHAALVEQLGGLAERYGEPYPWFGRARDLLRLGMPDEAADELHEAYLARRAARGRPMRRAGLEAVYRGVEAPPRADDPEMRRRRASMDPESLRVWMDVASALGDEGTAVALSGWSRANERPRAYEDIVNRVSERHGIDPNLLYGVMRTESVYQKRIVSYAGAIGLMQIMPRTGRHIAYALEKEDYQTDDLLEPEVNLEFAAWYLASLIERFDGRIPLAIASYNGGPHNVRTWIRNHGHNIPLDAFLERIPFEQTHRYVRRVLTHYAAYRAQKGLPMVQLDTQLPSVQPDPVAF